MISERDRGWGLGTTEEKRVENRELTQLWERKSYRDRGWGFSVLLNIRNK